MHHRLRPYRFAGVLALASAFPAIAQACSTNPIIGEICASAVGFCPKNYVPADGRLLKARQYQALLALTQVQYGGTFSATALDGDIAVPDLRGRAVVGVGQSTDPNVPAPVVLAQQVGQPEVQLSAAQVPLTAHTHKATFALTGQAGVDIPAAQGALALDVSLPIATKTGGSGKPPDGAVYLGPVAGKAGSNTLTITGPYVATAPSGPATLAGQAKLVGGGPTAAIATTVTTMTGGVVTVGAPAAVGQAPVPTQSPALAMTICIAVDGIFPYFD